MLFNSFITSLLFNNHPVIFMLGAVIKSLKSPSPIQTKSKFGNWRAMSLNNFGFLAKVILATIPIVNFGLLLGLKFCLTSSISIPFLIKRDWPIFFEIPNSVSPQAIVVPLKINWKHFSIDQNSHLLAFEISALKNEYPWGE